MSGHCFDPMQQLTAYMRGQYTLYDELFFGEVNVEMTTRSFARGWWGWKRQWTTYDAFELKDSPIVSPTRILENGYSPDIQNRPTKHSEWLASVLCGHAPSLRKLPCKDLTDVYSDCDDVEESQLLYQPKTTTLACVLVGMVALALIFDCSFPNHLLSFTITFKYKATNI